MTAMIFAVIYSDVWSGHHYGWYIKHDLRFYHKPFTRIKKKSKNDNSNMELNFHYIRRQKDNNSFLLRNS